MFFFNNIFVRFTNLFSLVLHKHWLLFGPFLSTSWTVPFSLGLGSQPHAAKVKPFDGALQIVAADHFAVRDLMAQAIDRLVRIHWHIENVRGLG
jgi:hypothetical protein